MRRELLISYTAHGVLILLAFIITAFSKPMKLPEKVYNVRIIAAPRPEVTKPIETKPEEKQDIEAVPEPKPISKPEPKPAPKPPPEPQRTTEGGQGHITVDGADFKDDYYLNLIYMKVYRNWIAPATGKKLSTTIYFQITKVGEVKNAKIETRSGSSSYDQKALRTVLASSPFPELPQSYTGDHLGVHFEFVHNP